uniref:Uncharacterized protein n=1 Tax=Meloidogyne hapla TaxID=6305 RepID=A0A1I8BGQ5_MELHA
MKSNKSQGTSKRKGQMESSNNKKPNVKEVSKSDNESVNGSDSESEFDDEAGSDDGSEDESGSGDRASNVGANTNDNNQTGHGGLGPSGANQQTIPLNSKPKY